MQTNHTPSLTIVGFLFLIAAIFIDFMPAEQPLFNKLSLWSLSIGAMFFVASFIYHQIFHARRRLTTLEMVELHKDCIGTSFEQRLAQAIINDHHLTVNERTHIRVKVAQERQKQTIEAYKEDLINKKNQ